MAGETNASTRRGFLAGVVGVAAVGHSVNAAEPPAGGATVNPRMFSFVGGNTGTWSVQSMKTIKGEPLASIEKLDIVNASFVALPAGAKWVLRGVTSHARYTTRPEKEKLVKTQAPLGRPTATHGAMILIRKNAKWWDLTQDERRAIFEDQSKHTTVGLKYLPAIARRLHHCRDLETPEPFDFVTLFDFDKKDSNAFDEMLATMRASEEWKYIDREVDIRLEMV